MRFTREERLKGRNEIREVFSRGKRYVSKGDAGSKGSAGSKENTGRGGTKLFVLKNNLSHNRICFTFSRGFGNAVKRNRARRLGREAYRSLKPRLTGGNDLILLAYPGEAGVTYAMRAEQLQLLFARAGLLQ